MGGMVLRARVEGMGRVLFRGKLQVQGLITYLLISPGFMTKGETFTVPSLHVFVLA